MEEGNFSLEYMRGLRTTLEHNILLGNVPDVIAGLKKFGVIINVNMGMLGGVPLNMKVYGPELEEFAMPVKTWIDEGIRVTFEGGGNWRPIHTLITREVTVSDFGVRPEPGEVPEVVVLLPDEAVDRVTALKMTTNWAAEYVMGRGYHRLPGTGEICRLRGTGSRLSLPYRSMKFWTSRWWPQASAANSSTTIDNDWNLVWGASGM